MIALLILVFLPDDGKTVTVVCPLDGHKFSAYEIVSTNEWGGVDRDFCRHAYKTRPMEHYIWVCPKCCFAGAKKDYEAKLSEPDRTQLLKTLPAPGIHPLGKEAPRPGHEKYALLALVREALGAPVEEVGKAYLSAAWCWRQRGSVVLEDFEEWDRLWESYSLHRTPLELGKKNRTDYELEIARKVEKDIESKRHSGLNLLLAKYLAAYLWRKHGEIRKAARWLDSLEKGENSVVDNAVHQMRESIAEEERLFTLAGLRLESAVNAGKMEKKALAEAAYVVAEIRRRLGDPKAADWYSRAIETTPDEALKKLASGQKALSD